MLREIAFKCPSCGALCEDEVEDPGFDGLREKPEDAEGILRQKILCTTCGSDIDLEVRNNGAALLVTISGHHDSEVIVGNNVLDQSAAFEHWIDEMAIVPEVTFERTMDDLAILSEASIDASSRRVLNRMILTSYFAAIEQYLYGRLVRLVSNDTEAMLRLVSTDRELKAMKFTLAEFAQQPKLVEVEVMKRLQNLMWHNFEIVNQLYKAVLNKSIFPTAENRSYLNRMTEARHDCVHRNGYDKNDMRVNVTEDSLDDLRNALKAMYGCVDDAYREYQKEPGRQKATKMQIANALAKYSKAASTSTTSV
ncbi:hypothetical protein ASF29_23390 [Rhizobium sp. Leaf262]|nr:hypothetical protein ASF29_23390 [Rhizobium sp. Leaf262]